MAGLYDNLISDLEKLPKIAKNINWRPGGINDFGIDDVVQVLSLFRPKYSLENWIDHDLHPINSATSIGSVAHAYDETDYEPLRKILTDILEVEDMIRDEYDRQFRDGRVKLPHGAVKSEYLALSGNEFDHTLCDPLVLPLVSAFRMLLVANKKGDLLWVGNKSIATIWKEHKDFFQDLVADHRKMVIKVVEAQDVGDGKFVVQKNVTMNGVSRCVALWDSPVKKIVREFKL